VNHVTPLNWHGQLARIVLGVDDLDRAARFYQDVVGMTPAPTAAGDRRALGWGAGRHVLELVPGGPALVSYALEVADPDQLEQLVARVAEAGVAVSAIEDGDLLVHQLEDPEGRVLQLHGAVDRSGERTADAGRRPMRLQHITFATRSVPDLVWFYETVLDMRVSDRMGDRFAWLRCGHEHHTIAMVESDAATQLDHFSFDLAGWQDFRDWCDRLGVAGVDTAWGPGRHGPGNNLFIMFDDPDGYHVELSAEMELFYDDRAEYRPRVWEPATRTVNLWGQAPSWRAPLQVA
jgi:catechol-2,3-dioxygenase